ncbi:MAG: hypothetical protein HY505_00195 [Candidatus Yanofskybacteria bacterium]|nr:hypothetical protein [Candidatus Yanofskybacteria bacterium]
MKKRQVILVNQITDTGDDGWSKYSCGICVLKMLMVFKKPELQGVSIMMLIRQALERNGYIENVGWKHQALVDVAALYGVPTGFQKEFFNTPEKKKEGIKIMNDKIRSGLPVAISIFKEFNMPNSAHLVIVENFKKIGPFIIGYRIVDPYPGKRGNKYSVLKNKFLDGWRGGMIFLK